LLVSDHDVQLASSLARSAGDLLLALRNGSVLAGPSLRKSGDEISHLFLKNALAFHRPEDGLLSEEGARDEERPAQSRVWVVDPLDGTREYAEGREEWAVHVALCVDGVPSASAVAIPARGQLFSSEGGGETRSPGPDEARASLRIAVSRSYRPPFADRVAAALGAELVPLGSAGFKAMAVLTGEVDAYLHAGELREWDWLAPVGVALAAGLRASRVDGTALAYDGADARLRDLLVCRPELAGSILAGIAQGRDADT
jgi:3'(2'), 5'-bisphosphate nucleotidase